MNIKYDKKVNSLYLTVKKGLVFKTSKITQKILLDKDENNNVLGVEIIDIPSFKNLKL
jgi:uncharacterized protein YuzE